MQMWFQKTYRKACRMTGRPKLSKRTSRMPRRSATSAWVSSHQLILPTRSISKHLTGMPLRNSLHLRFLCWSRDALVALVEWWYALELHWKRLVSQNVLQVDDDKRQSSVFIRGASLSTTSFVAYTLPVTGRHPSSF